MASHTRQAWESYGTKLTLISLFLSSLAAFSSRLARRGEHLGLRPFDLLLLGLSSFRVGRMIAYEGVAAPLRDPFTEVAPDPSGTGKTVVAQGSGVRRVVGELLSCPICTGTWVAAGLVYGIQLLPVPTRVFLWITSTTGVAEIVYGLTEALSWTGYDARKRASTRS